jgi:hypothetical protein
MSISPEKVRVVQVAVTAGGRVERSADPVREEDRKAVSSAARRWQARALESATVTLTCRRRRANQRHGS